MAIRVINYSITAEAISPSSVQRGGLQGEHRATELSFQIQSNLLERLAALSGSDGGNSVLYRFEAYSGSGLKNSTVPQEFDPADSGRLLTLTYPLENWLTRDGGNIRVYLIISVLNVAENDTMVDLYTYPALIKLENIPDAEFTDGNNYENMTTLSAVATESAQRAASAAASATESALAADRARELTDQARFALESGAEFIFLGGDAQNAIEVQLITEDELSDESENPVQNKAIKEYVDNVYKQYTENISAQINSLIGVGETLAEAENTEYLFFVVLGEE